jgi:hypothetical protein
MFDKFKRFPLLAAPALIGLGAAGFAASAGQAGSTVEPVRCEIQATAANGMIALEGILHTDVALTGSYVFKVKSSGGGGSSNIQQGGYFTADPAHPATLGTVMLGNSGGTYNASLEITSNGKTLACSERIGGAI